MKSAVSRPAVSHAPAPSSGQAADVFALAPPMAAQRQAIAAIYASPRSVAQRNTIARLRGGTVQRLPIPYDTGDKGEMAVHAPRVANVVGELDNRVMAAYEQALNWRTLIGHPDRMVQLWCEAAQAYGQNPEIEPDMVYARFGYAIESLACQGLNNVRLHGLDMRIQVAHGHTRPDVVGVAGDTEVLWLDITSEASAGHILGKDSSSWARRPYVYEICYPKLTLRALLNATDDPYYQELGGFLADEKQIEGDAKEASRARLRARFVALRDEQGFRSGFGNAAEKRRMTRDLFVAEAADQGVEEDSESMANTRGALEGLDINPGPFGFNRGEVSSRTQWLKMTVDASSAEETDVRKRQLNSGVSNRLITELHDLDAPRAFIDELQELYEVDPGSRHVALSAMAVKGVIADLRKLEALLAHVETAMDPGVERVLALEERLKAQLAGPKRADHDEMIAWRREVRALERDTAALPQVLAANQALHAYTVRKGIGFLNRPVEIRTWFQQLEADPPNAPVAQQVLQWVQAQPP